MTDSAANNSNPVLTFEGKKYDLNTLPDDLKELVRGMQVADAHQPLLSLSRCADLGFESIRQACGCAG